MPAPYEITPQQLSRLVGTADAPLIIDLRIDEDFDDDPRRVPGARRHSFTDLPGLAGHLKRLGVKNPVLYCQKGRKISQGAAAMLRHAGFEAQVLEGGQFAWRDEGLPMIGDLEIISNRLGQASVWVTRHRPKIDRIACPWLIRRFIDPEAKFLFVPPQDVALVAEKFGAIAFDVAEAQFGHRDEKCSFDAFIEDFELAHLPLQHMAKIIRAADTGKLAKADEAAGLLALSVGLSKIYRDDLAQLEAGMGVYDALYRWARDGMEERHNSADAPSNRGTKAGAKQ